MMYINTYNRSRTISPVAGYKGFDARVVFFLSVIGFLLIWSFWGKSFEKRVYIGHLQENPVFGKLGAQMTLSGSNSHTPAIAVGNVSPNSPADRAGLKPGDRIIGLDNHLISSLDMAKTVIGAKKNGTSLKITINRDGRNRTVYARFNDPLLEDQILKNQRLTENSLSGTKQVIVVAIFIKIVIVLLYFLYKNMSKRTVIVLSFAGLVLVLGAFFKSYSPIDALFAIKFDTISLLLGIGIISIVLDESGFMDHMAYKAGRFAGGSALKLFILFCLLTYAFSLLVNNLTTIMVMVPITLNLSLLLKFDPRPFIIGEVISSNLGGASTMMGDFPNMLISSEAGIGFGAFIIFMMPICLVLFGVLLIYLTQEIPDLNAQYQATASRKLIPKPEFSPVKSKALKRATFVLVHVIFLFIISRHISLNPSAVALLGGLSLFFFSGIDRRKIIGRIGVNDILFFTGLFVIVGALEASGLLQYISAGLSIFSFGKPWLLCLILMWTAAIFTAFLSAGPATALFFPIVLGFTLTLPNHVMWWALSLGVLAGSSATIFGATAGPVAATLVENFSAKHRLSLGDNNTISFRQFARIGAPVMVIFLAVSSVYITWLYFRSL